MSVQATLRRVSPGLTLLELIVALAVLAVLSTIAIQSLDPLADQSRYEATRRVLQELRQATLGDTRAVDGRPLVSGYLADTGYLPTTVDDLLTQPLGLIVHSMQTFDSDRDTVDDVSLASGWRGPYMLLGPGETTLVDGWRHAMLVDPDGGVFDFVSEGADGDSVLPESDYAANLSVELPAREYTASLTLRLFEIDGVLGTRIDPTPTGLEQLGVLLYAPNAAGGTNAAVEEILLPIASSGTFEVTVSNMLHGNIAVRGVLWNDTDSDDLFDVGESLVAVSYVHYVTIVGGADHRIEMELR